MLLTWMRTLPVRRRCDARLFSILGRLVELGTSSSVRNAGGELSFRRMVAFLLHAGGFSPLPVRAVLVPAPRAVSGREPRL